MGSVTKYSRRIRLQKAQGQNWKCFYCGCGMVYWEHKDKCAPPINAMTLDHLIPRHGANRRSDLQNTVACCWQCNQERGTRPWKNFLHEKIYKGEMAHG